MYSLTAAAAPDFRITPPEIFGPGGVSTLIWTYDKLMKQQCDFGFGQLPPGPGWSSGTSEIHSFSPFFFVRHQPRSQEAILICFAPVAFNEMIIWWSDMKPRAFTFSPNNGPVLVQKAISITSLLLLVTAAVGHCEIDGCRNGQNLITWLVLQQLCNISGTTQEQQVNNSTTLIRNNHILSQCSNFIRMTTKRVFVPFSLTTVQLFTL